MGRAGATVMGAVLLANVALAAGLAQSWVVQSGEKPIRTALNPADFGGETIIRTKKPADPGTQAGPGDQADQADPGEQAGPGDGDPGAGGEQRTIGFEIGVEDGGFLYGLMGEGEAVAFLDARPVAEYEAGHVSGAYRLMADELRNQALSTPVIEFGAITPETLLVIYCDGGDCEASHNLALYLRDYGFERVHVMVDGYPAWEQAGLPTEAGPDPLTGGDQ